MLPKQSRLDTKALASFFRERSSFYKGALVTLRVRKTKNHSNRWAFLVSSTIKKNAVARNTTKRRMREIARALTPKVTTQGLDIVFLLKINSKRPPSFRALQDDMIQTLNQWGILS